jgi:hypothetical protein
LNAVRGAKLDDSDGSPTRVVGRRRPQWGDGPPTKEARAAMEKMARYRTRVPKGIFIYASHEEANDDRERWLIDAMVATADARRNG